MHRHTPRRFIAVCLALSCLTQPLVAAVNDVMPGDYFPLSPGTTSVALYAFDRHLTGPYADGRQQFAGSIDSRTLALRLVNSFTIGDTTASTVLVLPWTTSEVSPAPLATRLGAEAQGFGDLRLGLTLWPLNDRANANYLGITAMVIAPTGAYNDARFINAGENRWRFVLGGGWQKDITPQLLIELSPEIAYYGDNDDYLGGRRLAQRTTYALTGYLRYRLNTAWHLHVGGQANRGGETQIAGVDQNNPANNDRLMAGVTWFLPERQQLILRAAHDVAIDNGFRSSREIALRYQKSF